MELRASNLVALRLRNQGITRAVARHAEDVVAWLGAVQAQEYPFAKWGLALRLPGAAGDADIERAVDEGRILRTHVLRPTWHFVTPDDIRWMLELSAARVHRTMAPYDRRLGLDPPVLTRATAVIERALGDGRHLTRLELGEALVRAGISTAPPRLAHIALYAELEGIICSGPRRGKRSTYALLAERAPRARRLPRDEAIAELARRYFQSHGPATIRDFSWWSGLAASDARRGVEIVRARAVTVGARKYWTVGTTRRGTAADPSVHLLPVYDEYLVAYRDRDAVPHGPSVVGSPSGGYVTFQHAVIVEGHVAGTWRPVKTSDGVSVDIRPLGRLTRSTRRALADAATRYARFLDVAVSLRVAG